MATKVDLSKDICRSLIDQGISLRNRQRNLATNNLIKDALDQEIAALTTAKGTLVEVK